MHVYWASVLMIPQGTIDDIHQLIRGFLWCNAKAWEAIRNRRNQVEWYRIVWFSYNIPIHAFHMWLVMRNGLKIHDKMWQWDVGPNGDLTNLRCALCDRQPDSRPYLFFECTFLEKVWRTFKNIRRSSEEISDGRCPITLGSMASSLMPRMSGPMMLIAAWSVQTLTSKVAALENIKLDLPAGLLALR
ncbi:homeodomain-like protein [Tanacetum coccineum]